MLKMLKMVKRKTRAAFILSRNLSSCQRIQFAQLASIHYVTSTHPLKRRIKSDALELTQVDRGSHIVWPSTLESHESVRVDELRPTRLLGRQVAQELAGVERLARNELAADARGFDSCVLLSADWPHRVEVEQLRHETLASLFHFGQLERPRGSMSDVRCLRLRGRGRGRHLGRARDGRRLDAQSLDQFLVVG